MSIAPQRRSAVAQFQGAVGVIAEGNTRTQKTVINFDNKQINIETAIGSNIIGGDVVDSLVEAV